MAAARRQRGCAAQQRGGHALSRGGAWHTFEAGAALARRLNAAARTTTCWLCMVTFMLATDGEADLRIRQSRQSCTQLATLDLIQNVWVQKVWVQIDVLPPVGTASASRCPILALSHKRAGLTPSRHVARPGLRRGGGARLRFILTK